MPVQFPIKTSFTAGEWSPLMLGRVDLEKYSSAASDITNYLVLPQGGVTRRGGSQFIQETKTGNDKIRLVKFEFSVTQAYVLEFGDLYIRFYRDLGVVENPPGTPVEISTPYTPADLFELQFVQSADILYLTHKNYPVAKVSRTSDVDWTYTSLSPINGPYGFVNPDVTFFLTPSALTGSITVTATGHSPFTVNDVDRLIQLSGGYVRVINFTSSTVVDATVEEVLTSTAATADWKLGEWYTGNYPGSIAFYEQRLWMAGTPTNPQTLWASKAGDFENFTAGANADDSLVYTLATDQVNSIEWLSPGKVLVVGTAGGEFIVSASSNDEAVTPTNVRIVRQTAHGCAGVLPVRIADIVLFLQRSARKIRQFTFAFESDSYVSPDVTLLAEHITLGGITELAHQREPNDVVYCVREDGALLSLTFLREQQVTAWAKHIIGGVADVGGGEAEVESVTVLPAPTGEAYDQVWVSVKRYINGQTRRYVEVISPGLRDTEIVEDSFFLDSGLKYSGASTATLSGLDHLEGESVSILTDGATHPDRTVVAGSVSLDRETQKASVGYNYTSELTTLNLEAGVAPGDSAQGKIKRMSSIAIRLYRSVGVNIGENKNKTDKIPFRSSSDPMDGPVQLFTGDKHTFFRGGFNTEGKIFFSQDQPLPQTVLAIMPKIRTNKV